jgi:small subunit ribosomal protein S13
MRIIGVNIPDGERVKIGLTEIYGIGRNNVQDLLDAANVDGTKRIHQLESEEVSRLNAVLQKFKVEGELKEEERKNVARLKKIKCYRGRRHQMGLPVHGQRTQTNARTRKGPKKTVGALRKKDWADLAERQQEVEKE